MLAKFAFGIVAAAGLALVAGCAGPRAHPYGARAASASTVGKRISEEALIDAHAHYATGAVAEQSDDMDTALKEYYVAAMLDSTNEALVMEVSRRFLEAGQPTNALTLLTNATQNPGAPGSLYSVVGFIYSRMGKFDLAAAADRVAIQRAPDSLSGYQNLYLDDVQARRLPDALKVLNEAEKVSDPDAEFLIGLAELYVNYSTQAPAEAKSARARAVAILDRAEKKQPTDALLVLRMADGFDELQSDEKAIKAYTAVLDKATQPVVRRGVRSKLVEIYRRNHDEKHAGEQLQAILQEDPANPEAFYLLGNLATSSGKYSEAADYFSKAILLKPDFEEAYYDLALAQLGDNKAKDALVTLEKVRRLTGPGFYLEYLTATAFSHETNYDEAIKHFNTAEIMARAADPSKLRNLHIFYFEFGAACERKGDIPQAEKYFEKCLQISPDFAEAQNYLGYMWADRGEKLDRAHDLIEKAVKAEPKNAAYLDSLGWVLYKLHRPKEALPYLQKAIEFSETQDATLFDHEGDIYSAMGETSKAREAWRKSLSVESSDTVRKKLEDAGSR